MKTESAGGIVVNARGEIALVKNGPSFWGFPKGHIDPGEDALAAAQREISEETGLQHFNLVKDLGSYARKGGIDMQEDKTIYMFLFRTDETDLAPIDPSNPEARWVAPSEVGKLLTNDRDRAFFESVTDAL
jgi:8-oxo-dGTP pyrophosphatase MutT (NUDIX family)